ncbi:MAG: SDR family oxidoreductase [Candidatus Omnitrophica bacterium]|nr:SDR family oxidoreductase [Candidatus Omnitrophota bacterium]
MNTGLSGKVALIGGASKGLGMGCALQLAREGVNVAICARGADKLKETAEFIRNNAKVEVLPIVADLSNKKDLKKMVDTVINKFGGIDILIVNSGGPKAAGFFDLSEQDWDDAYRSVFYYVVELYRNFIPQMKARKWGRIINIASLSVKEPAENLVLSNVFRSGVVSLAKTLSRDLIGHNITINNICPGAFKTDRAMQLILERSKTTGESVKEIEEKAISSLPLKRYQTPEELGDLVVFLASEAARGITGTTIQIDGGIYKGLF